MHRIQGDDASGQVSGIEPGQQVPDRGDLIALGLDRVLAEHDAAGVVERGDQVRCWAGVGPGSAQSLAVDRDHPASGDVADPAPGEHCQGGIQSGGVHPREQLAQGGLHWRPLQPEPVQLLSAQIQRPLPDRGERAGTGHHRTHRDGEHPGQRVTDPTWIAGIGNMVQGSHQVTGAFDRFRAGLRGRWHRRVWSWFGKVVW